MTRQPRILRRPRARLLDLVEHYAFIGKDNLAAAERFLDVIESNLSRLAAMPGMGRAWRSRSKRLQNVRVWPIPEIRNYIIFYRPLVHGIELLHILHAARDIASILESDEQV